MSTKDLSTPLFLLSAGLFVCAGCPISGAVVETSATTTSPTEATSATTDMTTVSMSDGPTTVSTTGGSCGDGVVDPDSEECDDGNDDNTDECLSDCTFASCGDDYIQTGVEDCDDGNTVGDDACPKDCTSLCGDGMVHGDEECDDGNAENTDACTDDCKSAACPDGFIQDGEECDDGNSDNTDECTELCLIASCGDEFVQKGEEDCDDGNDENTDECTEGCKLAACGDGYVQEGEEECDDSNQVDNDGCSSVCTLERRVFVSSTAYSSGEINGLTGANMVCQGLAEGAGLTGNYKAWLSDAAEGPSKTFGVDPQETPVPYILVDGTIVANSWADLIDGTLQNPINHDEHDGDMSSNLTVVVWTNTLPNGNPKNEQDCNSWGETDGDPPPQGNTGFSSSKVISWTNYTQNACPGDAHLYCFQVSP